MSQSDGIRERTLFRILTQAPIVYGLKSSTPGKVAIPGGTVRTGTGRQITVSESHIPDRNGKYKSGGPFYTDKVEVIDSSTVARLEQPTGPEYLRYVGNVYCPLPNKSELEALSLDPVKWKDPRSRSTSDLTPYGATAIAQCSPVNPVSTLGNAVTETVKEGLPSLPGIQAWKRKTEIAKAAAGEFLNAEFGWLPLVSDVKNVRDAAKHHSEILKQYHRDEGRNVRRDFYFPIEKSSSGFTTTGSSECREVHTGRFTTEPAVRSLSKTFERRRWFVGCFTYGLPSQTDSWRRALGYGSDADKLYGIALTPDILWELAPWSWAVDWFTNAGDVIHNITNWALAGQIMRYGYMMEESITEITVSLDHPGYYKTKGQAGPSVTYRHVSKVRAPANPFGFGLTSGSLSTTQQLIAAAVGITLL